MTIRLLLLAVLTSFQCLALNEGHLLALSQVESGGNFRAVSRTGAELGAYQFQKSTWDDVTRLRRSSGEKTWDFPAARMPVESSAYARTWLNHHYARLLSDLHRPPTDQELYATWSLGYQGFKKRKFNLAACPAITRDTAERYGRLTAQCATKLSQAGVLPN